jgi:hypothetical protein
VEGGQQLAQQVVSSAVWRCITSGGVGMWHVQHPVQMHLLFPLVH